MSGPKISEYELERRRWEEEDRIARQKAEQKRKEFERKQKELTEAIARMQDEIASYKTKSDRCKQVIAMNAGDAKATALRNTYMELMDLVDQGKQPFTFIDFPSAEQKRQELRQIQKKLVQKQNELQTQFDSWEREQRENLDRELEGLLGEEKQTSVQKMDTVLGEQTEKREKIKQEALAVINEWKAETLDSNVIYVSAVEKEIRVLENLFSLSDYRNVITYAKTNRRKLEQLKSELQAKEAEEQARQRLQKERFTTTYLSYKVACEMCDIEARSFDESEITDANVEWLRAEKIRLEELYMERRERQIVKEELEAVMEELGYKVIAAQETARRNGSVIKEQVYSFGEGTAVDIIEKDGQITMEVVGLDSCDRETVNEEEEYLENEMITFCSAHKEIEKKLAERGVVAANRIQMNPPSRKYAKILNISEYDQKVDHIAMMQDMVKGQRKQSAAAVSHMKQ